MSFRLRLTLFFILIVVLPMIALAVLVSEIAADSETGKTDARLSAGLRSATNLFERRQAASARAARQIAARASADPAAVQTLRGADHGEIETLASELADTAGVTWLRVRGSGRAAAATGDRRPVAVASVDIVAGDQRRIGTVTVATVTSRQFLRQVQMTTGEDAALIGPRGPIAGTVTVERGSLPRGGEGIDLEHEGQELRLAATKPLGEEKLQVALFAAAGEGGLLASRPTVALALVAFFALALVAVFALLRSLQGYIGEMLNAARRIGAGDFSEDVPVTGHDEMAGLALEFNRMSDRLSEQMGQLRRQRVEIEASVRRIGEAFAKGLDREALLGILVETAVGTCEADYGLVALSGHVGSEAEAGTATGSIQDVALAAEQRALREPGPVELERDGAYALSSRMGQIGPSETPVGAMTVAREGRSFTSTEREVFLYLVTQATASVENIALHELVSEQAMTDDLTGLANKRAFRELIESEAARAVRFQHDLSLLLIDLDDFKRINDEHGHLQGDAVLRAIGRVLKAESRGVDVPARYGGEEFAVALPETGLVGAAEVAERIRIGIEAQPIPMVDGGGELGITASLGLATLPINASSIQELIAAADDALYEAKRSGKNRVGNAPAAPAERAGVGRNPAHRAGT